MNHANRVAFAISKLGEQEEEKESLARAEALSNKMAVKRPKQEEAPAAPVQEETKLDDSTADQWSCARVQEFLAEQGASGNDGMDGAALLALDARGLNALVDGDVMRRRRLEFAIAKLREPIEAKRQAETEAAQKEEQAAARTFAGTIELKALEKGGSPTVVDQQRSLQEGIWAHLAYSERGAMFEMENTGMTKQPLPIIATLVVSDLVNMTCDKEKMRVWINPDVEMQVKVQRPGEVMVTHNQPKTKAPRTVVGGPIKTLNQSEPARFCFHLTWEFATLNQFLELDDERLCETEQVDVEFPPRRSSLFIDPEKPPPNTAPAQFRRIVKADSSLFGEELIVKQGRLGDCWFLAGLSLLSAAQIKNMFVDTSSWKDGFVTCRFFRDNRWHDVKVDTFIPCSPHTGFLPFDLSSQ